MQSEFEYSYFEKGIKKKTDYLVRHGGACQSQDLGGRHRLPSWTLFQKQTKTPGLHTYYTGTLPPNYISGLSLIMSKLKNY